MDGQNKKEFLTAAIQELIEEARERVEHGAGVNSAANSQELVQAEAPFCKLSPVSFAEDEGEGREGEEIPTRLALSSASEISKTRYGSTKGIQRMQIPAFSSALEAVATEHTSSRTSTPLNNQCLRSVESNDCSSLTLEAQNPTDFEIPFPSHMNSMASTRDVFASGLSKGAFKKFCLDQHPRLTYKFSESVSQHGLVSSTLHVGSKVFNSARGHPTEHLATLDVTSQAVDYIQRYGAKATQDNIVTILNNYAQKQRTTPLPQYNIKAASKVLGFTGKVVYQGQTFFADHICKTWKAAKEHLAEKAYHFFVRSREPHNMSLSGYRSHGASIDNRDGDRNISYIGNNSIKQCAKAPDEGPPEIAKQTQMIVHQTLAKVLETRIRAFAQNSDMRVSTYAQKQATDHATGAVKYGARLAVNGQVHEIDATFETFEKAKERLSDQVLACLDPSYVGVSDEAPMSSQTTLKGANQMSQASETGVVIQDSINQTTLSHEDIISRFNFLVLKIYDKPHHFNDCQFLNPPAASCTVTLPKGGRTFGDIATRYPSLRDARLAVAKEALDWLLLNEKAEKERCPHADRISPSIDLELGKTAASHLSTVVQTVYRTNPVWHLQSVIVDGIHWLTCTVEVRLPSGSKVLGDRANKYCDEYEAKCAAAKKALDYLQSFLNIQYVPSASKVLPLSPDPVSRAPLDTTTPVIQITEGQSFIGDVNTICQKLYRQDAIWHRQSRQGPSGTTIYSCTVQIPPNGRIFGDPACTFDDEYMARNRAARLALEYLESAFRIEYVIPRSPRRRASPSPRTDTVGDLSQLVNREFQAQPEWDIQTQLGRDSKLVYTCTVRVPPNGKLFGDPTKTFCSENVAKRVAATHAMAYLQTLSHNRDITLRLSKRSRSPSPDQTNRLPSSSDYYDGQAYRRPAGDYYNGCSFRAGVGDYYDGAREPRVIPMGDYYDGKAYNPIAGDYYNGITKSEVISPILPMPQACQKLATARGVDVMSQWLHDRAPPPSLAMTMPSTFPMFSELMSQQTSNCLAKMESAPAKRQKLIHVYSDTDTQRDEYGFIGSAAQSIQHVDGRYGF